VRERELDPGTGLVDEQRLRRAVRARLLPVHRDDALAAFRLDPDGV